MTVVTHDDTQRWIRISEAAVYLHVSRKTIYRWVEECRIPHIRPSKGIILFDRIALDKWLERQIYPTLEMQRTKQIRG
jgi:excisionase family DNA binding protein